MPSTKSVLELTRSVLSWSAHYGVSDNGMTALLKVLKLSLAATEQEPQHVPVSQQLPSTISKAISMITLSEPVQALELLTCRKCLSVYPDWRNINPWPVTSHNCIHVIAPLHTHAARRNVCDNPLFTHVQGTQTHVPRPILIYPYIPVGQSLRSFLQRPGFIELCQLFSRQPTSDDNDLLLCDIYDGNLWKDFSAIDGSHF